MSLGTGAILAALTTHAKTLGKFTQVLGHEPKSAPGKGLTCVFWAQELAPVPSSGLASTSVRLTAQARVYLPMLTQPEAAIDPAVWDAADALMAAYAGDFTLGGLIRCVDIFGQHGTALTAAAGYIGQDQTIYRAVTITIPLLINDLWTEAP